MTRRLETDASELLMGFGERCLSSHAVIAELGQATLTGADTDRLLDIAVRSIRDVLAVDYTAVLMGGGDSADPLVAASSGWDPPLDEAAPEGLRSLWALATEGGLPVSITDLDTEPRFVPWSLLRAHRVASGICVAIPGGHTPFGVLGAFSSKEHPFSTNNVDFLRSVAHILGMRMKADADKRAEERGFRYQAALAECAQALLVGSGAGRLERAARALLSATDAESVFIERNVDHPRLGLCSTTIAEADRPGTPAHDVDDTYDYWDLMPWDRMPTSRSHLQKGEPFIFFPRDLVGTEREVYAADPFPTKSELDIPIFADGEWAGVIAFSESSEERDWAEEDLSLLTAAAQMVGAYWEAENANERLQHLLASKDQLIASVSHELRTPLTSVVGFSRLLAIEDSGLSAEDRASVIQTIAEEGVDLANIIDDLLVAAKAESGTLAVVAVSIDLRAQVAQVVEACRPDDAARIQIAADPIRAVGDPARVRQILRNLISNALRYGGETIRVTLATEEESALVSVIDDGPGISPSDQERVFESYYRGQKDPGLAGSLGLGLTISLELARLMNGHLSYRYEGGESIFELRLPRMDWQI